MLSLPLHTYTFQSRASHWNVSAYKPIRLLHCNVLCLVAKSPQLMTCKNAFRRGNFLLARPQRFVSSPPRKLRPHHPFVSVVKQRGYIPIPISQSDAFLFHFHMASSLWLISFAQISCVSIPARFVSDQDPQATLLPAKLASVAELFRHHVQALLRRGKCVRTISDEVVAAAISSCQDH